jgi:diguanylate cyclase (GGDEF)-like protein/PAS domain S-box-containing protein
MSRSVRQSDADSNAAQQVRSCLDHLNVGISAFDADLKLILANGRVSELLGLPEELTRPGTRFEDVIRFNAIQGEYGPGDVEAQVKMRVERARNTQPHSFERKTRDGRTILITGNPLPTGGFVTTYADVTESKIAEEKKRAAEEQLLSFTRATPDAMIAFDEKGCIIFWNPGAEAIFGWSEAEALGKNIVDMAPADYMKFRQAWLKRMAKRAHRVGFVGKTIEEKGLRKDGEIFPMEFTLGHWTQDGSSYFNAVIRDTSRRSQIEAKLRQLSQAVEQSPASVVITDALGVIQYVNPRFTEVTGYDADFAIGQKPSLLKSGRTPDSLYAELWSTISSGREWRGELLNKRKNGQLFWEYAILSPIRDAKGRITNYVGVKEDISVRKEYEERLLRQANYDTLTGLPNRLLAMDRLKQSLAHANRHQGKVALMLIDLDDFKKVNDTLGHAAGDSLLKEMAERLTGCLREADTVARLGGDEFVVILPELAEPASAETIADKILAACAAPFQLGPNEVFVAGSIGIAIYPDDGEDAQVLMRNSDAAMYRAKKEGRATFRFFTPEMNRAALEHMRMEAQLRHAIERGEMELHYQPLIDNLTGQLVGAEALLRWNSPTLGQVPPADFIPLAEESGLIISIGEWVLRMACKQAKEWQASDGASFYVAVNLSARQFQQKTLVDIVKSALSDSGLPPSCLELELTESVLLADSEEVGSIVTELDAMGVGFAIDDFGTGFSSISYLRRFPFDTLKIDRSFIKDLTSNPDDANLVRSIIAMARSMRLRIVGEGVESQPQQEFLTDSGCDLTQGWLHSKPLPPKRFSELLNRWRTSGVL